MSLKWPEKLVIVRHGQSKQNVALDLLDSNLESVLQQKKVRDADVDLTEQGIRQAQQTGLYLARASFDIVRAIIIRTNQLPELY